MEAADFSNTSADSVIKAWAEVNSAAWKSWLGLMETALYHPPAKDKPSVESVSRFTDYQQLQLHLLKLSFQVWQELLPKFEAEEDWQQSLDQLTQELRTQIQDFFTQSTQSRQNTAELWQVYFQEFQKFNQLWVDTWGEFLDPLTQAYGSASSQPWIELNHCYGNLYEKMFGQGIEMPFVGPNRILNRKLIRAFEAWSKLHSASVDYQLVLSEIQIRAFEAFMRILISLSETGEPVKEWSQFQQLWSQTADRVFDQAFCSEDNLRIRGAFLNALNRYKLSQQELVETYLQSMNLPTRSEVDEVHKGIYELRKEVKHLKQTLAQYEAQEQTTPLTET
jgi:class III poly(R)-hydroxyalkanoic acid synthase PhaE subunit